MAITFTDLSNAVKFTGAVNNDTTSDFSLRGGRYALSLYSSGTASVVLNIKTPSGHYIACGAAVTTSGLFDLPPGVYQLVLGAAASTADGTLSPISFGGA